MFRYNSWNPGQNRQNQEPLSKCGRFQWGSPPALRFEFNNVGMKEYDFYTVVFGVSRALGCLSNGIWSRAFGLPIERPNSLDLEKIEKLE